MAKKRLLYIEDLYDFYTNKYKRSTKFSAEKSGEPLVVQVHGRVNFDESDKNKDGYCLYIYSHAIQIKC